MHDSHARWISSESLPVIPLYMEENLPWHVELFKEGDFIGENEATDKKTEVSLWPPSYRVLLGHGAAEPAVCACVLSREPAPSYREA